MTNAIITTETSTNFDKEIVMGSTKKAMAGVDSSKRDLWMVDIDSIKVMDGFNVRMQNASYFDHIRAIADSIHAEGFFPHEALAGYVVNENGVDVIYVTDGHCRLAGAKLARSEGAEISKLPMIMAPQGTTKEDITVALVKTATGRHLAPYEIGIVCSRMIKFGWDVKEIATRLNFGLPYVEDLLMLVGAPAKIREMVINEQISAANAVTALKTHGGKAVTMLEKAMERAQSKGATKVTAKHMEGATYKKAIKKNVPKMVSILEMLFNDPGFSELPENIKSQIQNVVAEINSAKEQKEDTPAEE